MARPTNPELEGRILQAARKLWHQGGEEALHMRAVAKAAGTNTPAVYRRFRTRDDLLRALLESYLQELFKSYSDCRSLAEISECFLDFALRHPREYQLIMSGLLARVTKERINFQFTVNRCAEWLGGSPQERQALILALYCMAHGLAMLKISGTLREENFSSARAAFRKSVAILIANAEQLRGL